VSTGEPAATESGHGWFGGGPPEKDQATWHLADGLPYRTAGSGGGCREKGQFTLAPRLAAYLTQESNGRAQAYGAARCGTRVIWLKLDCLNPNLQQVKMSTRRKDA
jgi:hypothetical protein